MLSLPPWLHCPFTRIIFKMLPGQALHGVNVLINALSFEFDSVLIMRMHEHHLFFFFKRQKNSHIDSTRFPSFRTAYRELLFIFSSNILDVRRSLSSYIKIWLTVRRLIAILLLARPPRGAKISFVSL